MGKEILLVFAAMLLLCGCAQEAPEVPITPEAPEGPIVPEQPEVPGEPKVPEPEVKEPPEPLPEGILVNEIPSNADVMFTSLRYVLDDPACLDENYELKERFVHDPECNPLIYAPDSQHASPFQIYAMDIETGDVTQITNMDCFFSSAQAIDSKKIMTIAICNDDDDDGLLNFNDEPDIYVLDLETEEMGCLTCEYDFIAVNNPDYSSATGKTVFSSGTGLGMNNHIFTIDSEKNLVQVTNDSEYMDFDCSWSEDGKKIVFNRLPQQDFPFTTPSQVWLMDADGSNLEKITGGGPTSDEENHWGLYPIGTDADPDLSPDNSEIVFSRLTTGKENAPFGVYELVVVDVDTKEITVLDSNYANMLPEWKEGGILILRQISGSAEPMDITQSLYLYKDGEFIELEDYPYNVFPLGAYSCSWIER